MGTDIHLLVEKFDGEKWQEVAPPFDTGWGYLSWSPYYESKDFNHGKPDPTKRNYNLFAFLADVRNGYGFAGVFTHKKVEPQFPGRGIPDDSSYSEPQYDEDDNWVSGSRSGLGDHSFTWATVTELLNVDWGVRFSSGGVVDPSEFKVWRQNGVPDSYRGGISGDGIITWKDTEVYGLMVDRDAYRRRENGAPLDYCFVTWEWNPLENCHFVQWVRDVLVPMCDGDTDSVRVVMGFDS